MSLEATLYYTLSTVSQTLAGALGLLAAVVLFALDRAERQLDAAANEVVIHTDGETLPISNDAKRRRTLRLKGDWAALRADWEKWSAASPTGFSAAQPAFLVFVAHLEHEVGLRIAFRRAAIATAIVILGAIAGLVVTPLIASTAAIAWSVLVGAFAGVVVCTELYRRLLLAIVLSRRAALAAIKEDA
jgi:hypothetical protein